MNELLLAGRCWFCWPNLAPVWKLLPPAFLDNNRPFAINQILLTLAKSNRMGPWGSSKRRSNQKKVSFSLPLLYRARTPVFHRSIYRSLLRFFLLNAPEYLSKLHFNEWDALGKSLSNPTKHSNKHHSSSVINCRLKFGESPLLLATSSCSYLFLLRVNTKLKADCRNFEPDLIRFILSFLFFFLPILFVSFFFVYRFGTINGNKSEFFSMQSL